ncbi:hypothetical protein GGP41_009361 [Bipolaris sorokiniana]|uniref:PNPLA domain-containing protein n=1 Tax=Cochliobolus sativus TaxID=45130 RepID=A0A8H5ZA49_COCSA|nr:hypothetical protein GGP41_009361 [Bipolaris sorokiniana]
MPPQPWISALYSHKSISLSTHRSCFEDRKEIETRPSIISFVGDRTKSRYLANLLGYTKPFERHGQIRLQSRPGCNGISTIYLDSEISLKTSEALNNTKKFPKRTSIDWFCPNTMSATDFSDQVMSHLLTPISSIICYFATDYGGLKGIASALARQAMLPLSHNLPTPVLPHILVVTSTSSKLYDTFGVQEELRMLIIKEIRSRVTDLTTYTAMQMIDQKFGRISLLGLQKRHTQHKRCEQLQEHLNMIAQEVYWIRRRKGYLFQLKHIEAFSTRIIENFCRTKSYFNFLRESRSPCFDDKELSSHFKEAIMLMPSTEYLWPVLCPLLASAMFLSSYPPGSHSIFSAAYIYLIPYLRLLDFQPAALFQEFYAEPCKQAISSYTQDPEIQTKFLSLIREKLEDHFRRLEFEPKVESARAQHSHCVKLLWPHLASIKSFRLCLCCLMFAPEKVFACGHAICNVCVRRFGQPSNSERHSYEIEQCVLCGFFQPPDQRNFTLIPPTAGIRILCVDGGGVRGVIPLMFLKHLESQIKHLGGPIHDLFDYVCGTSAGGLIAIGIFLMHWDPSTCLDRFEELSKATFKGKDHSLSISQKLQRVFRAWIQDHRYNLSPIERAFNPYSLAKMFNPLRNDTKVAVTATSVRENVPCVIANYNGGTRSDDSNYSHIRAANCHHDMTISDAAACTSAAPFFFKSKDVDHLDTFQDGGLQHNNPALLASWECAVLWPDKCQMFDTDKSHLDHLISLGTGTSSTEKHQVGPHSPKRDRFMRRLLGNFMRQMDGEEQWKTFVRCVSSEIRPRCHRLNLSFPGTEPALDDIAVIQDLKQEVSKLVEINPHIGKINDTMIASVFYFEVDSLTPLEGGSYQCCGTIFCRLTLDSLARRNLYKTLLESYSFFIIGGQSFPCAQSVPRGAPIYRKSASLIVKSLEDKLSIAITGITSEPTMISGMPTRLSSMIKAQGLYVPFGCIDNRDVCKEVPSLPLKRKVDDI